MNEYFNLNLNYKTKSTNKEQIERYNQYLKIKNKQSNKAKELKLEICIGFYSLINHLLKKRNILNYDNSIIILTKLYNKFDNYSNKKSSLYTYFYHIINNYSIDILRKNEKNKVDYVDSNIFNEVLDKNINKIDINDIKNILPKDEYEVILNKFWKVELSKKYSNRYYQLCLKTSLIRIKNHYL